MTNSEKAQKELLSLASSGAFEIYFDLVWVDEVVQVRVDHPLVCLVKPDAHLLFKCLHFLSS